MEWMNPHRRSEEEASHRASSGYVRLACQDLKRSSAAITYACRGRTHGVDLGRRGCRGAVCRLRRAGGAARSHALETASNSAETGPVNGNDTIRGATAITDRPVVAHTLDNGYLYPREHVRSEAPPSFGTTIATPSMASPVSSTFRRLRQRRPSHCTWPTRPPGGITLTPTKCFTASSMPWPHC